MALDKVRRSDPLRLSLSGYGVKKRLLLFRYIGQDLTEICMPLEQVIDFSTSAGPMRLLHFSKRPTINGTYISGTMAFSSIISALLQNSLVADENISCIMCRPLPANMKLVFICF